jgi:hypothetical protein
MMRKMIRYIDSCYECDYFDIEEEPWLCVLFDKTIDRGKEFDIQEWCEFEKV